MATITDDATVAKLLKDYYDELTLEDLLAFVTLADTTADSTEAEVAAAKAEKQQRVRQIIDGTQRMMKKYVNQISYTQLRKILQIVKKEEYEREVENFMLVVPRLAYQEGRPQKGNLGKDIIAFIRELAWQVTTPAQYQAFSEIMDTLVAYHKLYDN